MRLIKYVLLCFLFLLPLASAQSIRVIYFYNTGNVIPEQTLNQIRQVKNFWNGKVDWQELDYSNVSQRALFDKYNIFSLPVAIVECNEKIQRVNRSSEFGNELNDTIDKCIFQTTSVSTVIVNVANIQSINYWGIYVMAGLSLLLIIFVYRLGHKKAG